MTFFRVIYTKINPKRLTIDLKDYESILRISDDKGIQNFPEILTVCDKKNKNYMEFLINLETEGWQISIKKVEFLCYFNGAKQEETLKKYTYNFQEISNT